MKLTFAFAAASASLLFGTPAQAAPPTAEPPPATKDPVDGLVSSPDNFKLLLENDHVRVLQYTLLPGALDTLNIGTTPYVALLVEVKDAPPKAK